MIARPAISFSLAIARFPIRRINLFLLLAVLDLAGCGGGQSLREPVAAIVGLTTVRVLDTRTLAVPIREPFSVCYGQYLYLTDRSTGELFWCDTLGKRLGGGGYEGIRASGNGYLTEGRPGNFLLADPGGRRILRYDQRGVYRGLVLSGSANTSVSVSTPIAAVEAHDGTVWVVDQTDERLEPISPFLNYADSAEREIRPGRGLRRPSKIAVRRDTDFIVANTDGQELVIYDERGDERRRIVLPADVHPVAAAEGRSGALWLVDSDHARILAVNSHGEVLCAAGPVLDGAPENLREPADIIYRFGTTPATDELAVTDPGTGKIYFLRPLYLVP